ncbi:MAG: AraC family transcriptional regulator [Tannerella sp.]|nr:AraC family transcriptional regulator [Tannerella sp.]
MKTTVLVFLVCLPIFTALTGGIISFIASRASVTDDVLRLTRRLLYYFMTVAVTWTGIFFYLFMPEAFAVFFPFYCPAALCMPVALYAYIRQLIVCTKGEDSKGQKDERGGERDEREARWDERTERQRSSRFHAFALYIPTFLFSCLLVALYRKIDLLPLVRAVYSLVYFVLAVRLLWRSYRDAQTGKKTRLIPARWVTLMVALMFVLVINPLIVMTVSHTHITLLMLGMAAFLISTQSGILLYNTICRNFELFRESRKMPQTVGKKKMVSLYTPDSVSRRLPFTVQEFERLLRKNKLYLDPHLTLAALAERLDTNRSYVSGFINQTYGMNFNQYLNACRLKEFARLKALRANGRKNGSELAKMAGFGNYQHYLRAKDKQEIHAEGGGKDEQ